MGTADTPGCAIPAGGEDCISVLPGFGAIPPAVFDAALEPCTQRVMELAIPNSERANAAVATDMGVSGSALKRDRHSNGMPNTGTAQCSDYGSGAAHNPWSGSRQARLGFANNCFYKAKVSLFY